MANLHGPELNILINIALLVKNMFAASPVSTNMFAGPCYSFSFPLFLCFFKFVWTIFCSMLIQLQAVAFAGSRKSFYGLFSTSSATRIGKG